MCRHVLSPESTGVDSLCGRGWGQGRAHPGPMGVYSCCKIAVPSCGGQTLPSAADTLQLRGLDGACTGARWDDKSAVENLAAGEKGHAWERGEPVGPPVPRSDPIGEPSCSVRAGSADAGRRCAGDKSHGVGPNRGASPGLSSPGQWATSRGLGRHCAAHLRRRAEAAAVASRGLRPPGARRRLPPAGRLGFGRIVASEKEPPNMFVNLV